LPVFARDLNAHGAMTALLKDAIKPNLVQTLEGTPAILHGGPFANIAHGCNSVIATKIALRMSDYVVTEAGFGADLGAEKFLNIKCRKSGLNPNVVVLVATIRSLKYQGDGCLVAGLPNLTRHIENITKIYRLPCIVAINKFPTDSTDEIKVVFDECKKLSVPVELCDVHAKGGQGGIELANSVVKLCNDKPDGLSLLYKDSDTIIQKIESVSKKVYRANGVEFTDEAVTQIAKIEEMGYSNLPVCIAKTQSSFTDNAKVLGAPTNFNIKVKNVRLCAGAGFIVVLTGNIMTMPGLPKIPSAKKIGIDTKGNIIGLF